MARTNELAQWKERLNVSHRKFETIEPKIKKAWEYYKSNQWGDGTDTLYRDKIVENMVFSNIRAIVPRLNFRNPKIFVKPTKKPYRVKDGYFDTITASIYIEILLNHYYRKLEIKRESKKCLYDALLGVWGIMELGYSVETEIIKDDELLEVNELIKADSPFCTRRAPNDFRNDPEGMDPLLKDSSWIALRWVKRLDDLKRDPKYTNTTSLKSNYRVKTEFTSQKSGYKDSNSDEDPGLWGRVEGWTVWDKKNRRIMDVVEGHDKFLRNEKTWPLDLDGFPVEILYFNENATDIFPVSDTWIYLDMQDELNRIASSQLAHIRRISQRRYIAQDGMMTEAEETKLANGGDGTIAHTSGNVQTSILPLQDAGISQDIYINRQLIKKSIREMAGVSDTEAMASTKYESATEPALIEQSSQTLRGDQQATFENFTTRIVKKLSDILQQTLDETDIPLSSDQFGDKELMKFMGTKVAKIAGVEGATILLPWLTMSKDEIQGDYECEIEVGSTMPINEETRKRDAVSMYKLLSENPYMNGREGTKKVIESFGVQDVEKYLKPEGQMEKEQESGRQMGLQMEIAKDSPKRETDLAKTQIKSQTTKEVTAMKMQGDAQKIAMDQETHKMDLAKDHDKHMLDMLHTQENQSVSNRGAMLDLINKAKMGDLKLAEKKEMAKINLTNALKKGTKSESNV